MENSPIIFIDADEDDQTMFMQILAELAVPQPVLVFADGQAALDYLNRTTEIPFLILSEISMPGMSGLELRQHIENDSQMRKKSIPFVFMTYPVVDHLVEQAYEMTIQGMFEKKTSFEAWKKQLNEIIAYWTECYQPKRVTQ